MRRALSLAGALLVASLASSASAQEDAPLPPIAAATEAWEVGEIDKAGKLYEDALKQGGLTPSDTMAAFVRVGVWRASKGKTDAALNAFRNAAVIDPNFELPKEAPARSKAVYDRARKEAEGQPPLVVDVKAPEAPLAPGEPFHVVGSLPEPMVPFFDALSVKVADKQGTVVHAEELPADSAVDFTIPGDVVKAGQSLTVEVSALDPQHNEWARAVATVKAKKPPPPVIDEPAAPPPPPETAPFWSTKWPFVVGGAALLTVGVIVVATVAAGGSDVATVGAPSWQALSNSR